MQIFILVLLVAVGIQIVFLAVFLLAFSQKREKRNFSPGVSVVVCAHDEEHNLRELIPNLLSQDYQDFEVIVVNDRSNDETFDFLLEATKKDQRLRMVHVDRLPEHVNGKKYALTLGIKAATHEWILLTDADCRPHSSNWIRTMAAEFGDDTTFVLGYSPYLFKPGFLNAFIRFEALLTAIQYIGLALLKKPYMGVGRNLAYRKSFFLDNKGFNHLLPVIGGDDDLFVNQHAQGKQTRVVLGEESLIYSIPELSIKSFLQQKIRHLSVGRRYKLKHRLMLGVFVLSWLTVWLVGLPLLAFPSAVDNVLYYMVIGLLLTRIITLIITIHTASKQLGAKFELWLVLFLDFLYSIYYISTGLVALLTKKVRWRN